MTPEELRALADEATTEGGISEGWTTYRGFTPRERRLIVLAPNLAWLCAEYAGAFAQIEKLHHKDFDLAPQIASRALAKLSELKP